MKGRAWVVLGRNDAQQGAGDRPRRDGDQPTRRRRILGGGRADLADRTAAGECDARVAKQRASDVRVVREDDRDVSTPGRTLAVTDPGAQVAASARPGALRCRVRRTRDWAGRRPAGRPWAGPPWAGRRRARTLAARTAWLGGRLRRRRAGRCNCQGGQQYGNQARPP